MSGFLKGVNSMPPIDPGQNLYFPSKRDWWLVLLIWVAVIVGLVGGLAPVFLEDGALITKLLLAGVCLGVDALMLWVLYGTGYTIASDQLLIRCGPFTFPVPLEEINAITPTHNPLSSPACSLDRLKIAYLDSLRSIMISPKDKPGFLSTIVQRCPTLMVLNDGVMQKKEAGSPILPQAFHSQSLS
jgi:hypothetical protein